uniref:Uncharacterized protein n=1 Tax=Coniferiporia sulphurascens TaxID=175648 RepID=A0A5B9RBD5_CONSH|nr:hypothetical protein PSUO_000068 [Coniferiporia sulphurascens]QEG57194.1 hypothetical protein PSUO_000068 [Coniferiporia sulphurascens]
MLSYLLNHCYLPLVKDLNHLLWSTTLVVSCCNNSSKSATDNLFFNPLTFVNSLPESVTPPYILAPKATNLDNTCSSLSLPIVLSSTKDGSKGLSIKIESVSE